MGSINGLRLKWMKCRQWGTDAGTHTLDSGPGHSP
jgi:hypothetical protein